MEPTIHYDDLDDLLRRCGATWDAAQAHGLLSGRLAVGGAASGFDWLSKVLQGTDAGDAPCEECAGALTSLFEDTYRRLAERQSEFEPLLPNDDDATSIRAAALARWCEGYLHGLVSFDTDEAVKERLAAEPIADIIKDFLQITRADADDDSDDATNETAYAELVEYLRVASQLVYEELADLRQTNAGSEAVH